MIYIVEHNRHCVGVLTPGLGWSIQMAEEALSEEPDCIRSETTQKTRGGAMVCLLLQSGYSKQEGAYVKQQLVEILVRSDLGTRKEPRVVKT